MTQNEFTIGNPRPLQRNNRIIPIPFCFFALISLYFSITKNQTIKEFIKLESNPMYLSYLMIITLLISFFLIIYFFIKEKNIKTKLIINPNNILIRTYKKEILLDEKTLDKNNIFSIEYIYGRNTEMILLFTSNKKDPESTYTLNTNDIPLIDQSLKSIGNIGLENAEKIYNKGKMAKNEHNFLLKLLLIGSLFIILFGTAILAIALFYLKNNS